MSNRRQRLLFVVCASGIAWNTFTGKTEADAIRPWSGAKAEVFALGQTQTESGTTASGTASSSAQVGYHSGGYAGMINPGRMFYVNEQGSATAKVNGGSSELFRLDASYKTGDPGTRPIDVQSPGGVGANLSWSGDSLQLKAPAGATLPDHVRLDFGLSYETDNGLVYGIRDWRSYTPPIQLDVNGQHVQLDGVYAPYGFTSSGSALDPTLDAWKTGSGGFSYSPTLTANGRFHIDLPVNAQGFSDPFQLSLSTDANIGLESNTINIVNLIGLSLTLDDVVLPDGTSLASLGYGVSFASGLTPLSMALEPRPVPEPSMAIIGTVLAVTAIAARRLTDRRQSTTRSTSAQPSP